MAHGCVVEDVRTEQMALSITTVQRMEPVVVQGTWGMDTHPDGVTAKYGGGGGVESITAIQWECAKCCCAGAVY